MRPKYLLLLFALLTVLTTGYIFSNSLKDAEASHAQSGVVMEVVKPVLEPIIRQETEEKTERKLSFVVRKAAHFIEFAALGVCAGGFGAALSAVKKRRFWALPPVICLAVACCDEFIQSFMERTSSIKDVALDCTGSLFGLLLAAAAVWLLHHKKGGETQ